MDGAFVPAGSAELHPFVLNWFENIAAIQFNHRALAIFTVMAVIVLWATSLRSALPQPARFALHMLLAVTALQVVLGISTLILAVPIPLAAVHQAGAVLLPTVAVLARHSLRRPAGMDAGAAVPI